VKSKKTKQCGREGERERKKKHDSKTNEFVVVLFFANFVSHSWPWHWID